jgi:hypothetical protein
MPATRLTMPEGSEAAKTPGDPLSDFAALQAVIPGGMSKMPSHLREAIAWAEEEKRKRGMN